MKIEKLKNCTISKGFTLIELLIVIAIIGILAAVVIAVLNPVQQRAKANEAVLRTNVEKLCLAWGACLSSSSTGDLLDCDTPTEIGVTIPNLPTDAAYEYGTIVADTWAGQMDGAGTCTFICAADTYAVTESGTACVLK